MWRKDRPLFNLWYKKMIAVGIVFLLVGLIIGFCLGGYVTIKAVAEVGSHFLDEEVVAHALYQYRNNIAGCYSMDFEEFKNFTNPPSPF